MPDSPDLWYLRLPDGRVVRAAVSSLRQQIASGRITQDVQARRTASEEWRPLESISEFHDLRNGGESVASRLDPVTMQFVGVRALLVELVAALDSALSRRKLWVTALAAAAMGTLIAVSAADATLTWLFAGGVALVALVQVALLSRMTFHELSRLKPARIRDGLPGLTGLTFSLIVSLGLLIAGLIAARVAFPLVGPLLPEEWPRSALAEVAGLLITLLLLWGLVYLAALPAVLVVEDSGLFTGLGMWRRLTRGRGVMVAQWLTLAIALLLTGPVGLLAWASQNPIWQALVQGAMGAVAVTYLAVANVFLYLHFRYSGR
jgi:hypothetical protein